MYRNDDLNSIVRGAEAKKGFDFRQLNDLLRDVKLPSRIAAGQSSLALKDSDEMVHGAREVKKLSWEVVDITSYSTLKRLAESLQVRVPLRTWTVGADGERTEVTRRELPKYLVVPLDTETSGDLREDSVIKGPDKKIVIADLSKYLSLVQVGRVPFVTEEVEYVRGGQRFVTEKLVPDLTQAKTFMIYMENLKGHYAALPETERANLDANGGPLFPLREVLAVQGNVFAIMNSAFELRQFHKYAHDIGLIVDLWPLAKVLKPSSCLDKDPLKDDIENHFTRMKDLATPGSFSLAAISREFMGYFLSKEEQQAFWGQKKEKYTPEMTEYAALDAQVNFEGTVELVSRLNQWVAADRLAFLQRCAERVKNRAPKELSPKGELVRAYLAELRDLYKQRISLLDEAGILEPVLKLQARERALESDLYQRAGKWYEEQGASKDPIKVDGVELDVTRDSSGGLVAIRYESDFGAISRSPRTQTKYDPTRGSKLSPDFETRAPEKFTKEALDDFLAKVKKLSSADAKAVWAEVSERDYDSSSLKLQFGHSDLQALIHKVEGLTFDFPDVENLSAKDALKEVIFARVSRLELLRGAGLEEKYPYVLMRIRALRNDLREILAPEIPGRGLRAEPLLAPMAGGSFGMVTEEGIVSLTNPKPTGSVEKLRKKYPGEEFPFITRSVTKEVAEAVLDDMGFAPSDREEKLKFLFPEVGKTAPITEVNPKHGGFYKGFHA